MYMKLFMEWLLPEVDGRSSWDVTVTEELVTTQEEVAVAAMVVGADTVVIVETSVVIPMQVFGGSGSIQTIPAAKNNTSRENITTTERQEKCYMNDIASF